MAGRKKVELFIEVNNSKDFDTLLTKHKDQLICAEIYNEFFGPCVCMDRIFTHLKFNVSGGQLILLRVQAGDIEVLSRFCGRSEPFFMFITNKKVCQVFRGVDGIQIEKLGTKEIQIFQKNQAGAGIERPLFNIDEPTPSEKEWIKRAEREEMDEKNKLYQGIALRQAARKRHRAELMVPYLQQLNFLLFWPQSRHAHFELYERWDLNDIIMIGREEIQLTEDTARDILYNGDAPVNEASIHYLISGDALAICFRLLDEDVHFVSLVRKILYEDLPELDGTKPANEQLPLKTAYKKYASISPTREHIWKTRKEEEIKRKEILREKRARRLSELQRVAKQGIAEIMEKRKQEREEQKMLLLKSGNLDRLKELESSPIDSKTSIVVPEALSSEEEDEEIIQDPNEYFPPPGLFVPGFYAPPNDIAKANGLAFLFPKIVDDYVTPCQELLPPHVLVMVNANKRNKAIGLIGKLKKYLLNIGNIIALAPQCVLDCFDLEYYKHCKPTRQRSDLISELWPKKLKQSGISDTMGFFKATTPYDAKHVAYSVKQFNEMEISFDEEMKLCFMVSTERDFLLVQLMDLHPEHVSRDTDFGERECAAMFPVDYGDDYPQFEDFDYLEE